MNASGKIIYTCPHHPEVTSDKPGICEKCGGMELVPKDTESSDDTHGGMMSHGSAKEFLSKFYAVTFIIIPLFILSKPGMNLIGYADFSFRKYLQFALATAIFIIGRVFFLHASHELKSKKPGMMTLVSLGVGSGYLFSAVSTFAPALHAEFYLEIASLIWVLLFGHYLEAKSSTAAGDALQEVAKLLPQKAHVLKKGDIKEVSVENLEKDMKVKVGPGEKVPADGVIIKGSASFNEAHLTGESKLVKKSKGDEVIAGAICEGTVEVKLTRVGDNSTIGQIKDLVAKAQTTKPKTQKLADRASYWLTFIALSVSIATVLVWSLVLGETFVFSMTLAITVLVIACPHALGLAIPAVSTIATRMALENGIFIKDLKSLESSRDIDVVVFDKTGTLTEGKPSVSNFKIASNIKSISKNWKLNKKPKEFVKSAISSLESHSTHPIASVITDHLSAQKVEINNFQNIKGKGISGKVENLEITIGTKVLMQDHDIELDEELKNAIATWQAEGDTLAYVALGGKHVASFSLSDKIKPESKAAIKTLHKMGIEVTILTGDTKESAGKVADELKIDKVFANVLPEDKYKKITSLQKDGSKVMMVGDGVNDAPALTQADVGVAIGAGTDVAVESGDIVLTNSNPKDVVSLLKLSRHVYRKMIENLFWALGYNIIAIPAAAGVFIPWGIRLKPEFGAILMSLSSVIVVINAFTLKKKDI